MYGIGKQRDVYILANFIKLSLLPFKEAKIDKG